MNIKTNQCFSYSSDILIKKLIRLKCLDTLNILLALSIVYYPIILKINARVYYNFVIKVSTRRPFQTAWYFFTNSKIKL